MRNQILARAFIILFPYSKLCTCTQCQVLSTKNGSMEQQKQCNIDDVELIRTNWCSNEQRKEKICFHSLAFNHPNLCSSRTQHAAIQASLFHHHWQERTPKTSQQTRAITNKPAGSFSFE